MSLLLGGVRTSFRALRPVFWGANVHRPISLCEIEQVASGKVGVGCGYVGAEVARRVTQNLFFVDSQATQRNIAVESLVEDTRRKISERNPWLAYTDEREACNFQEMISIERLHIEEVASRSDVSISDLSCVISGIDNAFWDLRLPTPCRMA